MNQISHRRQYNRGRFPLLAGRLLLILGCGVSGICTYLAILLHYERGEGTGFDLRMVTLVLLHLPPTVWGVFFFDALEMPHD